MVDQESKNPFEMDDLPEKSQEFSGTDSRAEEISGKSEALDNSSETIPEMSELEKSAERVTDSVLATLDESGHELDTEEDGNVFWLIQSALWNIVKSLLAIGIIVFLLWVIWGESTDIRLPSFSSPKEVVKEKIEKGKQAIEKKAKPKKIPENSQSVIQSKSYQSVVATRWNMWLGERYRKSVRDVFGKATLALKDSDDLFSYPLALQIKGQSDTERARKVEALLKKINGLLSRYQEISGIFEFQIAQYSENLPLLSEDSLLAESQFLDSVKERRGDHLSSYIDRKIRNGNIQYENQNQIWARQVLLAEINRYRLALENLKANIETNKKALIQDVQVHEFLNDPFERVVR